MASTWATRNSVGCFPTLLMPTTNTGRPFACNWRDAGRTSTSEFFWRETSAGCPSRIIDCCCGLEARNAMVSPFETQPPNAAHSATIPRLRIRDSPRLIAIQEQPEGVGKRACACNHTVKIRGLLKTKDVDGRDPTAPKASRGKQAPAWAKAFGGKETPAMRESG